MIRLKLPYTIICILFAAVGCEHATVGNSQTSLPLIDTSWHLERIKYKSSETVISKNDPLKIIFKSDGSIEGTGGGNTFYGTYSYSSDNQTIEIAPEGMTFAGIIPGDSMIFSFIESLGKAESYSLHGSKLEIVFNGSDKLILSVKE